MVHALLWKASTLILVSWEEPCICRHEPSIRSWKLKKTKIFGLKTLTKSLFPVKQPHLNCRVGQYKSKWKRTYKCCIFQVWISFLKIDFFVGVKTSPDLSFFATPKWPFCDIWALFSQCRKKIIRKKRRTHTNVLFFCITISFYHMNDLTWLHYCA